MTTISHPLPTGTRVYYEDLDGGDGTITHNDNTTPEFIKAVAEFNDGSTWSRTDPKDMDYVVDFDDLGPIPVQREGILRVLPTGGGR